MDELNMMSGLIGCKIGSKRIIIEASVGSGRWRIRLADWKMEKI